MMTRRSTGVQANIPVYEETATVAKRRVETAKLRVSTVVHERRETVEAALQQESLDVQRIARNTPVNEPPPIRHEGDTIIIPLLEEVLVVEKRLVVREEIYIRKRTSRSRSAQPVTLRTEDAVVEHIPAGEEPITQAEARDLPPFHKSNEE